MLFFIALTLNSTERKWEGNDDYFFFDANIPLQYILSFKRGKRGKKLVLTSQDLSLFYGLCDGNPQLSAAKSRFLTVNCKQPSSNNFKLPKGIL